MKPSFNNFYTSIFCMAILFSACSNDEENITTDAEQTLTETVTNTNGFTTPDTSITLPETTFGNEPNCEQAEDDKFNAEFLVLINKHRKSLGLTEFDTNPIANYLAFKHTKYMICTGDFNHTNFNEIGSILRKTVQSSTVAENIIMGYNTPEKMLQGWLSSPPHKKNIETPGLTHTGFSAIKAEGRYWATQNFYAK